MQRGDSSANFRFQARRKRPGPAARGFTLIEILLVLALFALVAAVVMGGSGALLESVDHPDATDSALQAIARARHDAVLTGHTVELRFDPVARTLDWGSRRQPLAAGDVRFLPAVSSPAGLLGGRLHEAALPGVCFYADGTCDSFRLEIERGTGRQILSIDPWTGSALSAKSRPDRP